jgi:hypothetical protein
MASHYRHYWGKLTGAWRLNLQWDVIRDDSFVAISASEGSPSGNTNQPGRFIGTAFFRVSNIAPHPGGVTFRLQIGHYIFIPSVDGPGGSIAFVAWPQPLDTYVDYTVF